MSRDYQNDIDAIIGTEWKTLEIKGIPSTENIQLSGGARWVDATYLYADLADSSKMAKELDRRVAAKIIKCFLQASTNIVTESGGRVISFDGDRILAMFVGVSKNTSAVRTALGINWVVSRVMAPTFERRYESVRRASFKINHGVGVDTGRALMVRGGVRGNNDLISIGRAPNLAAKLSDLRGGFNSRITKAVYDSMNVSVKFAAEGVTNMWQPANWDFLEERIDIYRSTWSWKP